MLSDASKLALQSALVSRGKNKGKLLSSPPPQHKNPNGYAAWQAAMMVCNPFKVSIFGSMLIGRDNETRAVYDEVLAFFEANPRLRGIDRDRFALETLGVW